MHSKRYESHISKLMITLLLIICACQSAPVPEPLVETLVVVETVKADSVKVIKDVTPTPEPEGPRTLTICSNWAPDTLFMHWPTLMAAYRVWQIIYDGPIDENSLAYQPVILEKLPNLADGDAAINTIIVNEGDTVVDAGGSIVTLDSAADPPQMLRPAGGGEPLAYMGGEFEMDQLSATFKLLPNLTWSDGTPLVASDSVFKFNLLEEQSFGNFEFWLRTATYEAVDQRTTVWTGLPGDMDSTYFINFQSPLPEHVLGKYSPSDLSTAEEAALKPLGWGPYRIQEHILGEQIILEKNPHYFRANEGLPKFDILIINYITDSSGALISSLLSGECDIALGIDSEQLELMLELQNAEQVSTIISESTIFDHITFPIQPFSYDDGYQVGLDRPDFFSDVRIRRAIALCLDRQSAADLATFGMSPVLDTYIPEFHPLFNNQVPHYDYDPEAGIALLEEVGWVDHDGDPGTPRIANGVRNVADGTLFEFSYLTTHNRQPYAAVLEQSLIDCGIHAKLRTMTLAELFQSDPEIGNYYRGHEIMEFGLGSGPQPPCDLYLSSAVPGPVGESWFSIMDGVERTFITTSGVNISGFANQEYDDICMTALNELSGREGYIDAHHEAQRIYSELLPSIPLFTNVHFIAARPDSCNIILDPTGGELWNIEEFDYGEGCVE